MWGKSCGELACSDMTGFKDKTRWKSLDLSLSRALRWMIQSSGESLSEDVALKAREFAQRSNILRGRQIIRLMIDYFKDEPIIARAIHVAGYRDASMAGRR